MIKANDLNYRELRCGNWVMYKGEPIQVTMVGEYGIQSKTANSTINAKFQFDITPIPLTHEVLSKIKGFELIGNSFWGKGGYVLFIYEDGLLFQMGNQIVSYNPIKYLHQLQNLFYALTGKELSITL